MSAKNGGGSGDNPGNRNGSHERSGSSNPTGGRNTPDRRRGLPLSMQWLIRRNMRRVPRDGRSGNKHH